MAGIYVHVPFCVRKCPYCDFYSVAYNDGLADDYVSAVRNVLSSGRFDLATVDSIYFGGGTPSIIGAKRLSLILDSIYKSFPVSSDTEITVEANPSTGSSSLYSDLRSVGFNRISLGVQSTVDSELKLLGRPHNAADAISAVESAYNSGFENMSADLMLAIPGQTMDSLRESIEAVCRLPIAHISAYLLKIEPGTPFHSGGVAGLCPDEDETADFYLSCVRLLEENGFAQYEISNFSKPGYESRHNLKYWLGDNYLGVGPSAHSCIDGRRFSFGRSLDDFIATPFSTMHEEGVDNSFSEYAMLRLRLKSGLDLKEAQDMFGIDPEHILRKSAVFLEKNLMRRDEYSLSLTPEGFLLSNTIITDICF